jgi:hypothetical protein
LDRNNVTKSKVKTVEKARHLLIVEPVNLHDGIA